MILYDTDALFALLFGSMMLIFIGMLLIAVALATLFLKVGLKQVKGKNLDFKDVFITSLINVILNIIPCIGCIASWFVIKSRHRTTLGQAVVAWLISIILPFVILIAIFFAIWGGAEILGALPF
jgi:hypothetical protein